MKINDIINKLEKAGFTNTKAYKIVNITADGGWLVGKYLGPMTFTSKEDGEERTNHKFAVTEGDGLIAKGDTKVSPIEAGEVVVFGSGSLNYKLQDAIGKEVAVVYKGMETYKKGKKDIKAHAYEVRIK